MEMQMAGSDLGDARDMRVIIVDDDVTFCRLVAEVLEDEGIAVQWTTEGSECWRMWLEGTYDLVISDVYMPSMLGTELVARLRERDPDVRAILVSAFADQALIDTSRALGVALLSKPFDRGRLLEVISEVMLNAE
jgi:two-component system response regulator (stage 0 sporulation protein F)